MRALPHLLGCLFNQPLMVTPAKLDAIMGAIPAILAERRLPRILEFEGDEPGNPPRRFGYTVKQGVATVPVHGVLVRRAGQIGPDSTPLQSYERLSQVLQNAISDQRVRAVLLDVDSPGGEAGQALALASEVRRLSGSKPIWSVANDDAMSAAYGIAAGAQRLWVTPTSGVGSIGTLAVHTDQTQADFQQGVKYNFIHAGQRKVDYTSHRALGVEARDRLQNEIDRHQAMFVNSVANHRGVPPVKVMSTQAGLFFGSRAVDEGLADQVGTPSEAHAALAAYVTPTSATAFRSAAMSDRPTEQPQPQPQPQPPSEPTPAPQPQEPHRPEQEPPQQAAELSNVLTMARGQERDRNLEIVAACQLARRPDLIESLMRSDMTAEQVRRHLLLTAADQSAAARVTPTAATAPATPQGPQPPAPINNAEAYANARLQRRA